MMPGHDLDRYGRDLHRRYRRKFFFQEEKEVVQISLKGIQKEVSITHEVSYAHELWIHIPVSSSLEKISPY